VVSIDAATKKQIERRARNRIQQRNYYRYSAARKRQQNEIESEALSSQSVTQVDTPPSLDLIQGRLELADADKNATS